MTLEKDIQCLRGILSVIESEGHTVVHDWVEDAYEYLFVKKLPTENWNVIYQQNIEAIAKSDVVVAETSHESFAVGYQVASAVQQKKPVLLLRQSSADSNSWVTGLRGDWVRHERYDSKTLKPIMQGFFKENDIQTKDMRFNFFIDRPIYNYLRWASVKTGKTKAEILRELVEREIKSGS
ncbi:hypothetical protein CR970_03450 [Candidatus Saccharibacteria bacterium]|nr:MAG: hypothetical protein CR970_03450 [Candidatus Saccharibacteria bacterium]